MKLELERYQAQVEGAWPTRGRVILAQYDAKSVVVYQAYRPSIGRFAAEHQYFGGGFSLSRMTWIKPNFLWMMYRSGWGQSEGQEVVLAVRIRRSAFDAILRSAVPSAFAPSLYVDRAAWQRAVMDSEVRLQWDPDHDPKGAKLERRAIQLGLRGEACANYAREWIVDIQDISEFVGEQRRHVQGGGLDQLVTPRERPYPVADEVTAKVLGLEQGGVD